MRIYADEDGARKEEIAALAQPDTGSFSNFYDRLKDIKDYYRRFPTTDVTEVRIACVIAGGAVSSPCARMASMHGRGDHAQTLPDTPMSDLRARGPQYARCTRMAWHGHSWSMHAALPKRRRAETKSSCTRLTEAQRGNSMVPFPGVRREQVSCPTPSRPLACIPSSTASWPALSLTTSGSGAEFADSEGLTSTHHDPPHPRILRTPRSSAGRGSGAAAKGGHGPGQRS